MINPMKFDGLDPTASMVDATHPRWLKHQPPHLRSDVQHDLQVTMLHYLIEGRQAARQRSRLSELSRMIPPEPKSEAAAGGSGGIAHYQAEVMGKRSSVQGVIVRVKTCRGGGFEDNNSRCVYR